MDKRKPFNLKKLILIGCFVAAVSSFTYYEDLFQVSKNLEIFSSVYKELAVNYVDDVNSSKLMKTGIDAMLSNLDPYTNFVQESDMENYNMTFRSAKYGGIGATVIIRDGKTIITDTFEGSPANKADLRAGDEIVQINKIPVRGKDNDQTSVLLRGDKSSPVKMLISRPGVSAPIEKDLLRDEILQPNVTYFGMLPNNVGYIALDRFLQNSAQEVKNALTELQKNNPSGIILDLRNNGGGLVDQSI
ncbi:MAG TPA: peptidase S41, partial [Sphingobacteriaceae bacterium]|nr:peptidase S41 [Sphingobacteriaceae bacterium]